MVNILMGSLSFIFFLIYDINSTTLNNKLIRSCFFIGDFLLVAATGGLISAAVRDGLWNSERTVAFASLAILFLFLLIYTLFFSVPFEDTYAGINKPIKTFRTGFYALCRHPSALWFIGLYASLYIALPGRQMLLALLIFNLFHISYMVFQDRWTFMKIFSDYSDYKNTTPFLIPNRQSLKRCISTFRETDI